MVCAPPFGAPPFRAPPFGASTFLGLASRPLGPHHDTKNIGQKIGLAKKLEWPKNWNGQKLDWPKLALAKIGQIRMAKNGLAKVGLFRCPVHPCFKPLRRKDFQERPLPSTPFSTPEPAFVTENLHDQVGSVNRSTSAG